MLQGEDAAGAARHFVRAAEEAMAPGAQGAVQVHFDEVSGYAVGLA